MEFLDEAATYNNQFNFKPNIIKTDDLPKNISNQGFEINDDWV